MGISFEYFCVDVDLLVVVVVVGVVVAGAAAIDVVDPESARLRAAGSICIRPAQKRQRGAVESRRN